MEGSFWPSFAWQFSPVSILTFDWEKEHFHLNILAWDISLGFEQHSERPKRIILKLRSFIPKAGWWVSLWTRETTSCQGEFPRRRAPGVRQFPSCLTFAHAGWSWWDWIQGAQAPSLLLQTASAIPPPSFSFSGLLLSGFPALRQGKKREKKRNSTPPPTNRQIPSALAVKTQEWQFNFVSLCFFWFPSNEMLD